MEMAMLRSGALQTVMRGGSRNSVPSKPSFSSSDDHDDDLQEILMKLRDEHRCCLFCGCQYESAEALLSCCPGNSEDEH